MKAIIGTKVGMTNVFGTNGKTYATTIIHVEPNLVLSNKTINTDGYVATQVGYKEVKEKSKNKPDIGQFKKVKAAPRHIIRELRDVVGFDIGEEIKCDFFTKGEFVDVQGTSKGHGFTGSIKRHNFGVGPLGHGAGYPHRYVGSISGGRGGSQAQRVFKGTELPGHYGHENITVGNLLILDVIIEKNLILVWGAIPGPKNSYVFLKESQKSKGKTEVIELVDRTKKAKVEVKTEEVKEEVKVEVAPVAEVKTEEVKVEVAPIVETTEKIEENTTQEVSSNETKSGSEE